MRNETEATRALELYANTVRRICFLYLKNYADVEDVFQEVFLKYILHKAPFESDAHERAWLIRVSINACKDTLKSFFHRKVISLEDICAEPCDFQASEQNLLAAVVGLPEKYRAVLYLFYYEGYSATEIARIFHKKENTIYTWLDRGRKALKTQLGGDAFE